MEIKIIKVYLTGGKRIQELYEENQRFLQKQEELRKAVRAQDRQMRGYGRDFEALLREREALRAELEEKDRMLKNMDAQMDKWERMYMQSEDARKSLGEKLEHAVGALELLKERGEKGNESPHPSVSTGAPPFRQGGLAGEGMEGGARA